MANGRKSTAAEIAAVEALEKLIEGKSSLESFEDTHLCESAHQDADSILLEFIRASDFEEVADLYTKVKKQIGFYYV